MTANRKGVTKPGMKRIGTTEQALAWAFQDEKAFGAFRAASDASTRASASHSSTSRALQVIALGARVDASKHDAARYSADDADLLAYALHKVAGQRVGKWIAQHLEAGTRPPNAPRPARHVIASDPIECEMPSHATGWPASHANTGKAGRPKRIVSMCQQIETQGGRVERDQVRAGQDAWDSALAGVRAVCGAGLSSWHVVD